MAIAITTLFHWPTLSSVTFLVEEVWKGGGMAWCYLRYLYSLLFFLWDATGS